MCFGRLCAHHQEKQLYICDTWYLSLCVDDCLVCRVECIPDSHPHTVTNTKCRTDTVVSPDDGHIVARNMYRKEINIIRKIVHQVGFIYKIIQRCKVNKTLKKWVSLTSLSFNFLSRGKRYSFFWSIQGGCGVHPSSCSGGTGEGVALSLAVVAFRWPLPSRAKLKNSCTHIFAPQYGFGALMEWCVIRRV